MSNSIEANRRTTLETIHLTETYRDDQGKTGRPTVYYLGREQDSTDTLAEVLSH